jgi:hypothetical protein
MDKIKSLLARKLKEGKKVKPEEMGAKKSVLQELRADMAEKMGSKLGGLKKVSVAAPDSEGLKKGLEKAEDLVEGMEGLQDQSEEYSDGAEEEMLEEAEESDAMAMPEEMSEESDRMSEDEIDAKIQELLLKKQKLKGE